VGLANDRHVRVVAGERERVKLNKYGEEVSQGGRIFPASGVRSALVGHVQDHSQHHQEACDGGGSQDGLRPHVSAQEVIAETERQGSGAQREPGRNGHAVW
jgi:hypothetical protein